jgi:uncharacterized RDD family membrane protein YckC
VSRPAGRPAAGPADGPAQQRPASATPPLARPASLARRAGATLYEALLLVAMAFVAGFLFLPLVSPVASSARVPAVPPVLPRTLMLCALVAGAALYCSWSWSGGRRTLAQKTWRIRLVDRAGKPVGRGQALVRYAAAWIGPAAALAPYGAMRPAADAGYAAALLGLNYAWALVDRDRQFLHDRIAGTRAIRDA